MKVGKVTSVSFNQFKVRISSEIRGNSINSGGSLYYFGNIGSYLKVPNSIGEKLVCEVVSIFDNDPNMDGQAFDAESERELLLKPVGTIDRNDRFSLGVGIFPSIYSDVSIVTFDDMELILKTRDDANLQEEIHQSFLLGESKNLINYPVRVNINSFFNIHSAVLGNSGSGKSNTIAHIIQDIHRKINHSAIGSRILIFDVNGEYRNAFINNKKSDDIAVKLYKPNIAHPTDGALPFSLPHFLLNLDEWSSFLLATEATQRPFWDRVLQESYKFYKIATTEGNERARFINYLRYKTCSLIYLLSSQADSDTAVVTAAKNAIFGIRSLIDLDENLQAACGEEGLYQDLNTLYDSCGISFGNNNDQLKNAAEVVYEKIDHEGARAVLEQRSVREEYFDYRFLKLAASICLIEEDARGNGRLREYTSTMMTRLDYFLESSDCDFMRVCPENVRDETSYLSWLWDFDEGSHATQMVIIDTSELSPDALETLTSVVSRLNFSSRKKQSGQKRREDPIHLVLDEAHRYIKKNHSYILKENIFEKIAREGRKYSLYLLVSSQRPSELSETVLSQCGNFIIHRIQNELDMKYVYAILPYFSDDFAHKIKQSVPGEALVFGNCVSMPLHVRIAKADPEPNSKNCDVQAEWFKASGADLSTSIP